MKIRNPWGHGEWNGNWSDKSPLWTDYLKKQVGFVDRDDGVFFIDETDYVKQFKATSIVMYKDGYEKSYTEVVTPNSEGKCYKFTLHAKSKAISIQATQLTNRLTRATMGVPVSISRIMVAQLVDNKQYKFIGDDIEIFGSHAIVFIEKGLPAGDYIAYVEFCWQQPEKIHTGALTIYGELPEYEIVEYEDEHFLHNVLSQTIKR